MRAWMCLLEMGLLMAGCTDNPSTQPGGRDGGIDGDRGARPVAYGNRQVDVSHRVYRGEYLVRSFLDPRDSSIVYLDHDLDGSFLYRVPRNAKGSWDVDRKNREFTFGKRSFWDSRFNTKDKSFYVTSDDFNDETFNTYRVDLLSGKLEQKTAFQYSPSYHFNADESAILSVGRMNKFGNDECLTETLLRSGQKVTIFCNDGHLKLYPFVCPQEDPNSGTIAAVLNLKGDRSQLNIGLFKRDGGRPKVITDDSQKRARLNLLGWYKEKLYFVGNNGKEPAKLYAYSLPDDKIEVVAEDAALETLNTSFQEKMY